MKASKQSLPQDDHCHSFVPKSACIVTKLLLNSLLAVYGIALPRDNGLVYAVEIVEYL